MPDQNKLNMTALYCAMLMLISGVYLSNAANFTSGDASTRTSRRGDAAPATAFAICPSSYLARHVLYSILHAELSGANGIRRWIDPPAAGFAPFKDNVHGWCQIAKGGRGTGKYCRRTSSFVVGSHIDVRSSRYAHSSV